MSESFGAWTLESVIAVGGLGEVWRATRGVERAAIKRLHTHLIRNDDARAQFATEQRLTSELPRHPGVVHALEAGDVAGRPYIALALAPGEDLRRWMAPPVRPGAAHDAVAQPAAVGHLVRSQKLAIAAAACDAAGHLHAHGFVHGDINPGNLIVALDGTTTLVDLGIARAIGEAGAVRGTHAYMAPEQVRGGAWTAATDVFALGVVLWELMSGVRLFHRGPPWLSMAAVVEAAVPALADPALDAIAAAALVKDPAARLAGAGELAARLRAL